MASYLVQAILILLPWSLRRTLLARIWGFRIHPEARIGFSIVAPRVLEMGAGARIGHLGFYRAMDAIRMDDDSGIGNLNWIYGIPSSDTGGSRYASELVLERGARITHRHLIDCTERIRIGRFAVVAGYRSQLLTHSVDIAEGVQDARPISIGEYSFVSTGCILLGGSALPDYSVLGAGSVLRTASDQPYGLFSGTPAERVAELPEDAAFFSRADSYARFDS